MSVEETFRAAKMIGDFIDINIYLIAIVEAEQSGRNVRMVSRDDREVK
jgi:hypothetical protein